MGNAGTVNSIFLTVDVTGTLSSPGAFVNTILTSSTGDNVQLFSAGELTIEVPLDNNSAEYSIRLRSHVAAQAVASSPDGISGGTFSITTTSDFSHTLTIKSMLVRDASGALVTPESLGYSLQFGSGMASPNGDAPVTATPAPPGLVLMASGAVPLFGWLLRRRRLGAPATAV